jgi:hypothetical protein
VEFTRNYLLQRFHVSVEGSGVFPLSPNHAYYNRAPTKHQDSSGKWHTLKIVPGKIVRGPGKIDGRRRRRRRREAGENFSWNF